MIFSRPLLAAHKNQPWKVHEIASDFKLDMVWEFPIEADESKGETFVRFCEIEDQASSEPLPGIAEWLVRVRLFLDKLGLDGISKDRVIPGCRESSVRDRIKEEERAPLKQGSLRFPFRTAYERPNERLMELSNSTVHALLHIGWMHKRGTIYSPVMAVYVKPRGVLGRVYLALIYWFRVFIVYPALMRGARNRWERRRGDLRSA